MTSLRICFVTPGVLPMLARAPGVIYGGSEMRAWRFATGLAARGHRVSVIGFGREEISPERLAGVTIVRGASAAGVWARVLRQRRDDAGLWRSADADVYVAFGVGDYTADLAEWCASESRPLVLMAGSDHDFSEDYVPGGKGRNSYGSNFGRCFAAIAGATAIVVQSDTQRDLLRERFGREGILIRNPVAIPAAGPGAGPRSFALWMGKADRVKRPLLAIETARRCSAVRFKLVVNEADRNMADEVLADAPPNVEVIKAVPPDEVPHLLEGAFVLFNTSLFEGFPNTFLEAAIHGVPVLSLLADPDGFVSRQGKDFVAGGDMTGLAAAIMRLDRDRAAAAAAGAVLRAYAERFHRLEDRIAELDAAVQGLAERPPLLGQLAQ